MVILIHGNRRNPPKIMTLILNQRSQNLKPTTRRVKRKNDVSKMSSTAGTANDPLGIISTSNSTPTTCILSNISSRPALNGSFCQALEFANGRYTVVLLDANHAAASIVNSAATAPQPQYVKVQPSSLAKASQIDQVKLSALVAWETAKLYANHENVATIGRRLTPAPLRERVTPTQTLAGLAVIFCLGLLFLGYLIGFSKLMMAFSTLALLLMISSPDWTRGIKENKPIKLVVQQSVMNLGTRWKEMLKHSTGYDISYNMAVGSMILVLLWTGKTLFTPTNRGAFMHGRDTAALSTKPTYDLEFIYKLGYDDGKSGDVFGASLPADVVGSNTDSQHLGEYPSDWDTFNSPPLPKQRSSLGMGTLLSIFALFRFGKELVTHPGGGLITDPNLIIMKIKALEPWRLGLMLMSLYRVFGALKAQF